MGGRDVSSTFPKLLQKGGKSFLLSVQRDNEWVWQQSAPSFYSWSGIHVDGRLKKKKKWSSISRNDTESSTFSLQRVNLQFIPDSYSSEQIWSCAAAQAGNPRVWLPEESDATTGTGCETRQKLRFSRNGIWKMACRVSWWWRRGTRK